MRWFLPLILLAAVLPFASVSAQTAVRLDFRDAVNRALASSPALQETQGQLRAADGAATAAAGARWPRLGAAESAARSDDPLTVFGYKLSQRGATFGDFGAAQFAGPDSLNVTPTALDHPGAYSNYRTRVQLAWTLYAGGRLSATIARARAAIAAAQSGNMAARQAVILEVLRAYEGVRAATAQLAVARKTRTAAASDLAMARKRHDQGTVLKSDVLTAQVRFDRSRLGVRTASDQLDHAREYLRILTGLPQGTGIVIGPPAEPAMPAAPLATLQREAAAGNPTLLALRNQVEGGHAAVSIQKAAYRPQVSLVLGQDWNGRTLGGPSASSYTIGAVLSWDLFDFGIRRGNVAHARGELDAAQARVRAYQQRLQLELDRTWRRTREAADRVAVSRTAVRQAGEAQRILKLRYGQGLATITALLDGEAALDEAESELVAARYELRISRATLLDELGELDPARIGSGATDDSPESMPTAATGAQP
ncbi:MAG: TolC family protein [Rhodanobacteraceae bacterium]|nr:MAG: TolC family protein [Rhodanobacteraceae bacterium]